MELLGITSIQIPKGVLADEKELQYISALHQSCLPSIRSDGTISAEDILIFLKSRYGIEIKSEDAKDIAFNLCGGQERLIDEESVKKKPEAEFVGSAESVRDMDGFKSNPDGAFSDKSNPETDIYFDLVQVMALLLIPEMIRLKQEEDIGKGGVFESVLNQLFEPLNEDEEGNLRETEKLKKSVLKRILLGAGDLDTAHDDELLNKMLSMIGEDGAFNLHTFKECVTSDVSDNYSEGKDTSTFFDVFDVNWERLATDDEHEGNFHKKNTLAFLDPATSSYHSNNYKVVTWCLGLLSIGFYWMFNGSTHFSREIDELITCDSFWCNSARKILSFSITVIVVGVCGLVFVLLTNLGNIGGKYQRATLVSITATAVLALFPCIGLSVYRSRMPIDSVDTVTYRNICPFNHTNQPPQSAIKLDDRCLPAKEWCREHPEVQGQNFIGNKLMLSHEEMKRCLNIVNSSSVFSLAHYCVDENCTLPNNPDNQPSCNPDSSFGQCIMGDYRGDCGRILDTSTSESVCCLSGTAMDTLHGPTCTRQSNSKPCTTNKICDSNNCVNGFCEPKKIQNKRKPIGSACTENGACSSNYCNPESLCDIEPTICPLFYEEAYFWTGIEIFPFCMTEEEFCLGHVDTFIPECNCTCIIEKLTNSSILNNIPNEEAETVTETTRNVSIMEEAMEDRVAFPIFLSIWLFAILSLSYQLKLYFFGTHLNTRYYDLKMAAKSKLSIFIENAMELRKSDTSENMEGEVMRNYFLSGVEYELIGGLLWTFSGLKSRNIMTTEGISIPSRLMIANILQTLALIIFLIASINLIKDYAHNLDNYRNNYDVVYLSKNLAIREWYTSASRTDDFPPQKYIDKIPAGWIVYGAGIPATILTMFVGIVCTIVPVPSYVLHVLMYRRGVIESFTDPGFSNLRGASDLVNQNLGNIVFSLFGGCVLTFSIVFLVLFLIMWHVTRPFLIKALGIVFGIGISAVVGLVLQAISRGKFIVALYRRSVFGANITGVFFECWNFSTAALTIIKRIGLVVATSFIGLGRIDIPFLHPSLGNDAVADNFRREVLVHDAHMHPYLDRLSGMYMRRLRDRERFGSVEGQAWRCLFVIGLCPWLVKYRINRSHSSEETL